MNLFNQLSFKEKQRDWVDLMNYEWVDYEDFEHKYGSDSNPESFAQRFSLMFYFEGIGQMLKDGWIDIERVTQLVGNYCIWLWNKYKSIIEAQRIQYNLPNMFLNFQYLAEEIEKQTKKQHPSYTVPTTYVRYIQES